MNPNLGIKELARLAEVSIGTVDRVLHNREGVSSATKEKVLRIVEETGYKKNVMASRLKLASIKVIKVAVLVPKTSKEVSYWDLPIKGVERAVDELKELGVTSNIYEFDLLNPKTFSDRIDEILDKGYDGLVTVPFFERESNVLLEKASAENIPVVFFDTERELNLPSNFINQNSINAGKVAGRLLYGLLGDEADYIVVNILNERGKQINNSQREEGFRSFFEENFKDKDVKIYAINHPLQDGLDLSEEVEYLLKKNKPSGIFVTNARSFLLPDILKKYKVTKTKIVGFDLNAKNVAYLESGEINFLINQKPEFQGYSSVKGIYKFLTEEDDSLLNLKIPVEIVVKENLSDYDK